MKLLSFQPFSLFANGGGNRILRRLYQGKEAQVTSLAALGVIAEKNTGSLHETGVYLFPPTRRWMRWYLRNLNIWLRDSVFKDWNTRRIRKAAASFDYTTLHVVNHGPYSAALCTGSFCSDKQLWVSFHDHFRATHSSFEDAGRLWRMAGRRLVISEELGNEYQRLFGHLGYEIITDGVESSELSEPARATAVPAEIYFAGLLHLEYLPLFRVLGDALDSLCQNGDEFKLVLRGAQHLPFLANRLFGVEYRPLTLDGAELKQEVDAAAVLYLPLKFVDPDFYLYSLSTKMVGYLGGSGAVLYHGPVDSAACTMLERSAAALCCTSLAVYELSAAIRTLLNDKKQISQNAKVLAKEKFDLPGIRARFWNYNGPE